MDNNKLARELYELATKCESIRNSMKYQAMYILAHDRLLGIVQRLETLSQEVAKSQEGESENNTDTKLP